MAMYWGWWNTLVDKYSRPNTKLFVLLIINEPSLLFDTPSSRPSIAIARVLPRPKAAFLQELCFEDTVQLRPPQKKTSSLINDIDIFCCLQKNPNGVTWSWSKSPPEKQPAVPARSRPCSFAEALLMFPSLCIFFFVAYFFVCIF